MSIERFVAFFLGPIIAAASAWLAGAGAKYGLHLSAGEVTAVATAGAVSAGTGIVTWLKGRQNPELLKIEADAKAVLGKLPEGLRAELEAFIEAEVAKGQRAFAGLLHEHKVTGTGLTKPVVTLEGKPNVSVSDAEEMEHQPHAAPADSTRPQSAIVPDALTPAAPTPAAAQAGFTSQAAAQAAGFVG